MSTTSTNTAVVTLEQAHGTVMIFAWITFASTGVLFARYGRHLHFGDHKKLFGSDIWFQMHRSILILAAITTLIGFIIILVKGDNDSVTISRDEQRIKGHGALGFIIVGCTLVQIVMGFFRCTPQSTYRFIFNWIHRVVGSLAFLLSIPAIFLVVSVLKTNLSGLMIIMSLWAAWIVIVVIVLEIIQYRNRPKSSSMENKVEAHKGEQELDGRKMQQVQNDSNNDNTESTKVNNVTVSLFILNLIIAVALSIALIVLIWKQ